ncbi:MAG: alpha/beta fold hydrolase [Planctomycetes bacterium]|nr:alpha/beta fold hydrolase [Planctomycetota bacterium]
MDEDVVDGKRTEGQNSETGIPTSPASGEVRSFRASDGYEFQYRHWRPRCEKPLGYVVALHGIQSHSGWYGYSSSRMAAAGFDVRFLDRRGSGLNESDRGHAEHPDRLLNDVIQFLGHVRHERNGVAATSPLVLLAVSWGGKLAAAVAGKRPELIDALALLSPGICARIRPTRWQKTLLLLANFLGKLQKTAKIPLADPALFTDQEKWREFIRDDEYALHRATAGFFLASDRLGRLAECAPPNIRCPFLLMLAGKDRIIDNDATRRLFARFASPQRTLIEYEQAAHTLEFDQDRAVIFTELIHWLKTAAVNAC